MRSSDTDLIQRVLDGDQNAFTVLVNRYQKRVHTLVWRKIGDFHIAEEITQDVFLKAYKKLSMLKPPYHFSGWLYVIASRRCIAWLRKKKSPTISLDAMPAVQLEEVSYTQYETALGEAEGVDHQRNLVKRLLEKLPESERTVVTLHYVSEMPCKDISQFLGVSPNTVKSRLHRARERLKKHEHLLHDVSGIFKLPPTLTDDIMREVARIKPTAPPVNKPWMPWGISFASALLVLLMIGLGQSALFRFQQPYSLDATSEITIELIDAPIVLPLRSKPDVKTRFGDTNTVGRSSSEGLKVDTQLPSVTQSDAVDMLETEPQWIQSKELTGGDIRNLFLTSGKVLYAAGSAGLYRLNGDNNTEWILINASLPLTDQSEPMAEWNGTLYIATQTDLFASADRGVTWDPIGPRPQGRAIALLITNTPQVRRPQAAQIEMFLILANRVFRSTDAGNTWHAFNDGLSGLEIQDAVAVGNVLFLGTKQGLYRFNSGAWEKLPIVQSQSINSLAVADNRIYFSAGNSDDEWSESFFASNDLGASWTDITPTGLGPTSPLISGSVKLVAVDATVFVLGAGVLRSGDAGSTWENLGFNKHGFTFNTVPAIALDKNTIFVAGTTSGIGRTIDGGSTWHSFMTGITELHILDLARVNNALYATTNKGIAKSTDDGELWTSVETESSLPLDESLSTLQLSNMAAVGDSLYVRAKQDGNTDYLFHLRSGTDMLLPIKGMPNYVDSNHSDGMKSRTYTSDAFDPSEIGQTDISRYLTGIEKTTAKTADGFAVTGDTFYIEHDRRLYRWTPGELEWHDMGVQDDPVFDDFYATDGFQFAASRNVVYLGKSNGVLCQSLDGGDTWRDVTADLPFMLNRTESQDQILKELPYFKEIVFAGSTVYVATSDGVAMSNDDENWSLLTDSEYTPISMSQLVVDGTTLYGISQTGVYRLDNDTFTWMQIASEVPERVTSLVVDGDVLYIGTEHRGILRLPIRNL